MQYDSLKLYCERKKFKVMYVDNIVVFVVPSNKDAEFDKWCIGAFEKRIFDYISMPDAYVYSVSKETFEQEFQLKNYGLYFSINRQRYVLITDSIENRIELIKSIRNVKYFNASFDVVNIGLKEAKDLMEARIEDLIYTSAPVGVYPVLESGTYPEPN